MADLPRRQVVNVALLSGAYLLHTLAGFLQALSTTVAAGGLLADAGQPLGLASLPYSLLFVVAAFMPPVVAAAVQRLGGYKRPFAVACAVGVIGGFVGATALYVRSFAVLCVASILLGVPNTAGNFFRFAAVTLVPPQHMAKAVSAVLVSGLVASIILAPIADSVADLFPSYPDLPIYLAISGIYIVMAFLLAFVRYPAAPPPAGPKVPPAAATGADSGGDSGANVSINGHDDDDDDGRSDDDDDDDRDRTGDDDARDGDGKSNNRRMRGAAPGGRSGRDVTETSRLLDAPARARPLTRPSPAASTSADATTVTVRAILTSPPTLVCMAGAAVAYLVMTTLMTIAPVEIEPRFAAGVATNVMSAHALCMFLPFFVAGVLNERLGEPAVLVVGLATLLASVLVMLLAYSTWSFYVGMCLVGAGWSLAFLAATTALTKLYTPAQRPKAQAVNDVVVFGTVALCTALSAVIYEAIAWAGVLYVCLGVATAGLVIGLVNLTSHRLRA